LPTYPNPTGSSLAACDASFISEITGLGVQFGTPGNREIMKLLGLKEPHLSTPNAVNSKFEEALCTTLGIKSPDDAVLPDRKVLALWGVPDKIVAMKPESAGKSRKVAEAPPKKAAKVAEPKPVATPKVAALDERFAGLATTAALVLYPLGETLREDYGDNPKAAALAKKVAALSDEFAALAGID
jgi:hypothetical protein